MYKTHLSQKIAYFCVLVERGYLSSGSTNLFIGWEAINFSKLHSMAQKHFLLFQLMHTIIKSQKY